MNKRGLALLALCGAAAWWYWRKSGGGESYLIDSANYDAAEGDSGFLKVATSNLIDTAGYMVNGSINGDLTPSLQLINFTKNYEQFRAYPYYATAEERRQGKMTIGYGHLIVKGDDFTYPMTKEFADQLFLADLNSHILQIYSKIKVRLNQHQFDAICDFCFNTGRSSLKVYYTLTELINAGKFSEAADRLMQYTKQGGVVVPGLMNRRYSQMNMFRFGKYERYNGFN